MMEFTYDGLVRWGFGFYNPNHAAALICAILPFLWLAALSKNLSARIFGCAFSAILLAALALTYSRAGIVVMIIEAALCLLFYGRRYWKLFAAAGALFAVFIIVANGAGRLSFDSAMSNRIDIWLGGILLFAKNPLGVGLGNSGAIVSAYMLPDGVVCRTLINSHLTLLCELGLVVGILWALALLYAFLNNIPRKDTEAFRFAAFTSFAGLLVSASMSSLFDWELLFYPSRFPSMTLLNVSMEWTTFLLFLAIAFYLLCRKFSKGAFATSLLIGLLVFGGIFAFSTSSADVPRVRLISGECFTSLSKSPTSLVLFDDSHILKDVLKFLKKHNLSEGAIMPIRSWQNYESIPNCKADKVVLFGACADFASQCPQSTEVLLVSPSQYFNPTAKNIKAVYLSKWNPQYGALRDKCRLIGISIIDI